MATGAPLMAADLLRFQIVNWSLVAVRQWKGYDDRQSGRQHSVTHQECVASAEIPSVGNNPGSKTEARHKNILFR
jgi:hypothetical protein